MSGAALAMAARVADGVKAWAVWSYTDGHLYASDPPTQEAAERNAALLWADGESCEAVPEDVGRKMANAYAHGRFAGRHTGATS